MLVIGGIASGRLSGLKGKPPRCRVGATFTRMGSATRRGAAAELSLKRELTEDKLGRPSANHNATNRPPAIPPITNISLISFPKHSSERRERKYRREESNLHALAGTWT